MGDSQPFPQAKYCTVKLFLITKCYNIYFMGKKNTVENNIMKFRLKAGITQEELALRSRLSQGYITQLEHEVRNYTQKALELIAVAMSVPLIEFFKEREIDQASAVAEDVGIYQKKRSYKKEFMPILNDLPEYIVGHYLTLLKLERELMRKKEEEKPGDKRREETMKIKTWKSAVAIRGLRSVFLIVTT